MFDKLERGWKVLMVTAIGVYLVSLDVTVVNIAFPALSEEFSETSRNTLSWVLSGYNIAFAAALLSAGRIADRFGRRRSGSPASRSSRLGVACGLAPTAGLLIAARIVQAIGGALVVPSQPGARPPRVPAEPPKWRPSASPARSVASPPQPARASAASSSRA